MPSTEGLKLLVRKTKLDYGEWLEMLEARRLLLKPHLDSVSLRKLEDVECLKHENFLNRLGGNHPLGRSDKRFSLETQGIFSGSWKTTHSSPSGMPFPDGVKQGWGLTRSALWILVRVDFKGDPGYKRRGLQTATAVDIQEATPARIVEMTGYTAKRIWEELGRAVHNWLLDRRRLYLQIEETSHQITMEERALSVIEIENSQESRP